jgi:uncharacterized protein
VELKKLAIQDKGTFERFLGLRSHELSVYAFPAIYGWKNIFEIRWGIVNSALCVFFGDATGFFLYLPPLAKATDKGVIEECFRTMDALNRNPRVSRIENVEERECAVFQGMGYGPVFKAYDFVYERRALAALRGDAFKSKRNLANYFTKNNVFQLLPYCGEYKDSCVQLYKEWMAGRAAKNSETVYCGMLSDSLSCLDAVLEDPQELGIVGQVVLVEGKIKAFTLGYRLNEETLCVFFEIADLSLKGISQFLFRGFCRAMKDFQYVNAMDDSGLENLKAVKESYKPFARAAGYIINRCDAYA